MDWSQLNSFVTSGASSAGTVASALAPKQAAVHTTPKATATNGTSNSGSAGSSAASDPSDITSDDFLTLLVSELQNQDPTQPTDPNQYITQLAQVNSLEQLISINQGIGTLDGALSAPAPGSGSGASSDAVAAVTSANAALGLQSIPGQNAIWGGSTAS